MRRLKIIFICKLTICLLTWSVFVTELDALRGSAVVLQAKAKADKKNLDQDEPIDVDENGEQVELNVTTTTKPTLTGIPQIDYVYDPNLPRELNGYNLSDYPFLNSVPQEIDFKCDGLHDGFYASMPHKCQLYHHCLFGTRFDFLCANYTAFDQKTFICHFVSQVDCPNSAKYYNRNEALYKTAETTTLSTTTTSTSTTAAPPPPPPLPPQQSFYPQQQYQQPQQYHQQQQYQQQMPYESRRAMPPGYGQGRKRRPAYRRRRPVYEYYYVDDYDDQPEYYDESVEHMPIPKKHIRKHSRFNNYNKQTNLEVDYPESSSEPDTPPSGNYKINRGSQQQQHQKQQPQHSQQSQQSQQQQQQQSQTTVVTKNVSNQIMSVYDKPRAPPKIRRPVPINERDRYDYTSPSKTSQQAMVPAMVVSTTTPITVTTTMAAVAPAAKPKGKEQQSSTEEPPVEYYDDEEEDVPDDEYALEPDVAPAAKPEVAALKPEPVKPIKAAPRTSVVTDYDTDHSRRTSVTTVVRPKANRASTPQPVSTAVRKKPASDHVDVADDYEDELPAAATRQSIAAATKQRPSGPFLARPPKPAKAKTPQLVPVVPDDEEEEPGTYIQQQQPSQAARQPQRVSVRQVMAAPHRNRPQQQTTDHLHAQYNSNNNNKQIRAAATVNNRRPARPVYEYADEYYDE